MVSMKNATGNVYKNVHENRVDDMLRKGFIIVKETKGGNTPPLAPLQDEAQKAAQSAAEAMQNANQSAKIGIELVEVVEIQTKSNKLGDRYWNQLNKAQLRELMDKENVKYDESNTVAELRTIYKRHLDSQKRKKRR